MNSMRGLARPARAATGILVMAAGLLAGCASGREAVRMAGGGVDGVASGAAPSGDVARAVDGIPAALADADTVRADTLAPGVRHIYAWDARGPWGIHLLEIDAARCEPVYSARKAGPPQSARARTSELAADALAGINADFFRLPGGTTVSAHVEDGRIVAGPGSRPVLALSDGRWWIGRAIVDGRTWRRNGDDIVPIVQVNRTHPDDTIGAVLFTHWYGGETPADTTAAAVAPASGRAAEGAEMAATGAASSSRGVAGSAVVAVSVRRIASGARDEDATGGAQRRRGPGGDGRPGEHRGPGDDDGMGVVITVDTLGGPQTLMAGTVVLRARGAAAAELRRLAAGDTVAWSVGLVQAAAGERDSRPARDTDGAAGNDRRSAVGGVRPKGAATTPGPSAAVATEWVARGAVVQEAVGGYPILLRNGDLAPELDDGVSRAFGERRHPRTAVGFADGGRRMLWLVVDGRQAPYSAGMSLGEVAGLLRDLGAEEALNLDGGGSSALVVRGRVVNRPSDPTGERPVGNALLLAECRADA